MTWKRARGNTWELTSNRFEGKALLKETNSGFIASIRVENTDFNMELVNERDFFERKRKALAFLQQHMEKHSYE